MSPFLRRRVGGAVTALGALLLASSGNASGSAAAEPPIEPVAMHHTYVEKVVSSSAETVVLALANGQTIRVPSSLYND
ncbi:MAG: hypothetical protein LC798_18140 [Chloroflexi bacterium]|nr:hypothetical protein [Chloroflexota bacterium]